MERQMEVYAGFLAHTDYQVGRLLDDLAARGAAERTLTILLSDNGSSGEGGPYGMASSMPGFNGVRETREEVISLIDEWGGPHTYPNYATGWAMAGNSPNRWYKQFAHEGGTRAPLIVSWPEAIKDRGEIRGQFHAAPDVMPTVLDVFHLEMPNVLAGAAQRPLEGTSFSYTLNDPDVPTNKVSQYFEMFGHRAIWAKGWKAVTAHWTPEVESMFFGEAGGASTAGEFDDDEWELYNLDLDFSESTDRSAEHPEVLRRLIELWWSEAGRYGVLPLDDHMGFRTAVTGPQVTAHRIFEPRDRYTYRSRVELPPGVSPNLRNRSHTITVRCEFREDSRGGVLVADGGPEGGYSLCVLDGDVHYVTNYLGREVTVASVERVPRGQIEIEVGFVKTGEHAGEVRLSVNGSEGKPVSVPRTNPVRYDARGGGFCIGTDSGGVWTGYRPPFRFEGLIQEVSIVCEGAEHRDRAAEFRMHLAEQ